MRIFKQARYCKAIEIFVIVSFLLGGCYWPDASSVNLSGRLIVSNGVDIRSIRLEDPENEQLILYRVSEGSIGSIARVGDEELIFEGCYSNQLPGVGCAVTLFDSVADTFEPLRRGWAPYFMSGHNKLFFYTKDSSESELTSLMMADLHDESVATEITTITLDARSSISRQMKPVVQVSKDSVVYLNKDRELMRLDVPDMVRNFVRRPGCVPEIWRSQTKELLCSQARGREVSLLDLESGEKDIIPELGGALGFVYLAQYDALVYQKLGWRFPVGEEFDIYYFSFSERKESVLLEHTSLEYGFWVR